MDEKYFEITIVIAPKSFSYEYKIELFLPSEVRTDEKHFS